MNARTRFYYNGKLKYSEPGTLDSLRRRLARIEASWAENIMPQVAPGEFDPNNASEVSRVSADELRVVTTGGHRLHWKIVPQPAQVTGG